MHKKECKNNKPNDVSLTDISILFFLFCKCQNSRAAAVEQKFLIVPCIRVSRLVLSIVIAKTINKVPGDSLPLCAQPRN